MSTFLPILGNKKVFISFGLECGVPQGSCLGPLLLTIYASKLFSIIKSQPAVCTLVCRRCSIIILIISAIRRYCTREAEVLHAMENCIEDVRSWMINDKLMLNDDKTKFLVIGTSKQLSKVFVSSIRIGDVDVIPIHSAKNLGSWFDSHTDKATQTTKTCTSAFFYLYNIRHMVHVLGN